MPRLLPQALVACVLLAGCGGGTITRQPIGARGSDSVPTHRVRVMLPAPNVADEPSGRIVAARIIQVLQQTHADVALIASADPSAALADARAAQATFLIQPSILEWTDSHAPPLTADRVRLRLDLYDVPAAEIVSAVTFENQSSLFTVVDTRPEALLDASFDRAVTMLMTTAALPQAAGRQPGPDVLERVPVDEQKFPRQ